MLFVSNVILVITFTKGSYTSFTKGLPIPPIFKFFFLLLQIKFYVVMIHLVADWLDSWFKIL